MASPSLLAPQFRLLRVLQMLQRKLGGRLLSLLLSSPLCLSRKIRASVAGMWDANLYGEHLAVLRAVLVHHGISGMR